MNDLSFTSNHGDETCHHDLEESCARKAGDKEEDKIAKSETYTLTWMRMGLAAVLLGTTVLVCFALFWLVKSAEEDDFQNAFEDYSGKILEAFQEEAERRLGAVASFAASLTAHTLATNATW